MTGKVGLAQRWTSGCVSGKRGYPTRREAKFVASRAARMGNDRLHPYRCQEEGCTQYHLGHLPRRVKTGDVTRREYYGDAA